MVKFVEAFKRRFFDQTVDFAHIIRTAGVWGAGLVMVYLTNVLLVRLIGVEQYGRFALFTNWASLAATFILFGWDHHIMQLVPRLPRDAHGRITDRSFLRRAGFTFLVVGLLCLLAFLLFRYSGFFGFLQDDTRLTWLFVGLAVLLLLGAFFKAILKVFNRVMWVQGMDDLARPLLTLAAVLVFFLWLPGDLSLFVYLIIYTGITALVSWVFYAVYRRTAKQHFAPVPSIQTDHSAWIHKGFYFMFISFGYTLYLRLELVFLGYFQLTGDVARYQILFRMAELVIIPDFLFNYYLPQRFSGMFARQEHAEARILFQQSARTIFSLQLIVLILVAGLGYFYLMSFGLQNAEMYLMLLVLASAQLWYSVFGSANLVLMVSGHEKLAFGSLGIVLILECAANFLLTGTYGLWAAVWITWGGALAYNFLLALAAKKQLGFVAFRGLRIARSGGT